MTTYWGNTWKKGTEVLVTNGDYTIGKGKIMKFKDKKKLWAYVKLNDKTADTKGYGIKNKPGYVLAYKGYSYRLT